MLETLSSTRVVAAPAAIDTITAPRHAVVLRLAPDEALVLDATAEEVGVADAHAIVVADAGWRGTWVSVSEAERLLTAGADWHPPPERPTLAQGMLFQLPVKLWLEDERVLLIAQHVVAADLEARMGAAT